MSSGTRLRGSATSKSSQSTPGTDNSKADSKTDSLNEKKDLHWMAVVGVVVLIVSVTYISTNRAVQSVQKRGPVAEYEQKYHEKDEDHSDHWNASLQTAVKSAKDLVLDGLHSVRVNKYDATKLERELQGELFDKYHEFWETTEAEGIPVSKLTEYLDHLEEAYEGVNAAKIKGILIANKWKEKIFEWKYDKGQTSEARYGMIALGKSPDGKYIDSMFVMYKLVFKIAPTRQVTTTKKSYLWGLWTDTYEDVQVIERSLGARDNSRLQNLFRMKALQGFYKEGFIHSINYVDSLEAVADHSKK